MLAASCFNPCITSGVVNTDTILRPFMSKLKKLGSFFQGKYVAEDDTWKITNYVVELDRLKKGALARNKNIDFANPEVIRELKQEAANIIILN